MAKHDKKNRARVIADKSEKCYAYLMTFGTYEYVSGKKQSKQFERENAEIISQRVTFTNVGEQKKHKKQYNKKNDNPTTPPRQKKQTEETDRSTESAVGNGFKKDRRRTTRTSFTSTLEDHIAISAYCILYSLSQRYWKR